MVFWGVFGGFRSPFSLFIFSVNFNKMALREAFLFTRISQNVKVTVAVKPKIPRLKPNPQKPPKKPKQKIKNKPDYFDMQIYK
jgi:hypothetical protein